MLPRRAGCVGRWPEEAVNVPPGSSGPGPAIALFGRQPSPGSWWRAPSTTSQAAARQLPAARRDAVTTCHRYLTRYVDQFHYDIALTAGRPIATGAVEGACRHLIADRLDITGARWGLYGAEAVLQLHALITNGDLEDYCIFHTDREHQRLCPSPDQRNYSLTA